MPYVEVHDSILDHPKVSRLSATLNLPLTSVVGHLIALWVTVIRVEPSGVVPAEAIPQLARWYRKKDFVQALIDCGFADKVTDGIQIHNWERYTKGYRKAVADKERMRDRRATIARPSPDGPATVAVTGSALHGTDQDTDLHSPTGGPLDLLHTLARTQKIAGRPETIRQYVESWYARVGAAETEKMLMASTGKTVMEIQDEFFPRNGKGDPMTEGGKLFLKKGNA